MMGVAGTASPHFKITGERGEGCPLPLCFYTHAKGTLAMGGASKHTPPNYKCLWQCKLHHACLFLTLTADISNIELTSQALPDPLPNNK